MRKTTLTKEEQWIEERADEFVPVNKEKYNEIVQALGSRRKGHEKKER